MVIVSIVKQVPAPEARLKLHDGMPDFEGVTFVLDGMDEYGVEQALRVREDGTDAELVVLGYGPEGGDHVVRTALAMGLDRGVYLEQEAWDDPLAVAMALGDVVREVGAELVFVGGKQSDWDSAAVGPALAEVLGWAHVTWATAFTLRGESFEAVHDVDEGSERVQGELPVVVTTQQGLNDPRYPTLPSIMKARRKPLDVRQAVASEGAVRVRTYLPLELDRRRIVLQGDVRTAAQELVRRLRDEAKVL